MSLSSRAGAVAALCVLLVAAGVLVLVDRGGDPAGGADRGRTLFAQRFAPAQGLGPLFNERSCAGCHLEPSAGGVGRHGLATATRVGRLRGDRFDPMIGRGGPFAHAHAITGLAASCGLAAGIPAGANVSSVRNAPPLFGDGLIDAIPERVIRAGAVAKAGGVHGRPNLVRGPDGRERVGRFGWKADTPTLAQFAAEAFRNELGVTSPAARDLRRCGSRTDEIGRGDVAAVAQFVASLAAPAPRRSDPLGEQVFAQTGCTACHVPSLRAGARRVPLYSDLLLHDMGPLLDDRVDQAAATGRDWRTAPLWGLSRRPRYLHDGRAQSLAAAILAHGGEARRAQARFRALSTQQRRRLLAFLRTL